MFPSILKRSAVSFSTNVLPVADAVIERNEYIDRRRLLAEQVECNLNSESNQRPLIIITASAKQQFSAQDVPYPYRQSSYFRYLTGLVDPKTLLTIVKYPNKPPISTLYFTARTTQEELWEGPAPDSTKLEVISGVDDIRDMKLLDKDLDKLGSAIGYCDINQFTKEDWVLKILSSKGKVLPLREFMDAIRWIKSPKEQKIIRRTCEIGGKAMNGMISKCLGITNENEVVGRLELEMRRRGASYLAYPPVVAGGARTNIIHYIDANQELNDSDIVLVDAGCEYEGYVSDISRVFPVCGKFTATQKALYEALLQAHKELLKIAEKVRPLTLNQLYVAMLNELVNNLTQLNIFSEALTKEQIISEVDKLCPHHVSHYLGMDVHDTPTVPRNIPVMPGVVFTVEPGVYIRTDNKIVKEEFRGLGMRIEDDVLVTENGIELLTKSSLRESCEIEKIMGATLHDTI